MDKFFENLENETLNLWKQINQIQNESLSYLECEVSFFNLLELKEIRKNLNNISLINDINIKKLSYKNTTYDINYYGNLEQLSKIFKLNKIKINYIENSCSIRLI